MSSCIFLVHFLGRLMVCIHCSKLDSSLNMMAALVITVTLFLSVGAQRVTLRGGRSNDWIADLNVSPTLAEVTRLRRFACNIRFLYYAIILLLRMVDISNLFSM